MSRMTMSTVNAAGVTAALRAWSGAARSRVQQVVIQSGYRTHDYALALCPYDALELDDFHMVEHLELNFSPDLAVPGIGRGARSESEAFWERFGTTALRGMLAAGVQWGTFAYEVGFYGRDFLEAGQPEYFIYTEFGTVKMTAQPCIFPARDLERAQFLAELRVAMAPRPSDR